MTLKLFDGIHKTHLDTPDGVPNNEWNNYKFVNNTQLTAHMVKLHMVTIVVGE